MSRRKDGAISEWNKYSTRTTKRIDHLTVTKGAPAAILAVAVEIRAAARS